MSGPVLLVSSPNAGTARSAEEAADALRAAGVEVADVLPVDELGDEPRGHEWHRQGVAAVVAAGGDGTLCAVVNAIGDAPLALGILPFGTNNDSARSLDLPLGLDAVRVVAEGEPRAVDVGEVVDAEGRRSRFLHAVSVGLNAEFARLATDAERRRLFGALTYPVSMVEALVNARPRPIRLRLDGGEEIGGTALQVAAINLPHVLGGGPLGVDLPDLGPDDGKLVVLIVRTLLKIDRHECRSLELAIDDPDARITLDGELAGPAPATVRLVPRGLRVLLPRTDSSETDAKRQRSGDRPPAG